MTKATNYPQIIALAGGIIYFASTIPLSADIIWTGGTSGAWDLNSNWSTDYPDGSGEVARFNDTVDTTITLDTDITVGSIQHRTADGLVHAEGTITIGGTGSITFADPSGVGSIMSQQSSDVLLSNHTGPINISNDLILNVDTFQIGTSVNRNSTVAQMTAALGRNVTVYSDTTNNNSRIFSGNNDFGIGTLYLTGNGGRHTFEGANSAGGPATTINVSNNRIDFAATDADGGNFGNDVKILNSGETELFYKSTNSSGPLTLGSITSNDNNTLRIITTIDGSLLQINSGESISIGNNGVVYLDNFNGFRKGDLHFIAGSSLIGKGTIATNPGGTVTPLMILKAGATLSPGATSGDTAIFNVGNATYSDTTLTLEAGAIAKFDLNGTVAGTAHDQLTLNGTIDLTGAILDLDINYDFLASDVITLLSNNGGTIVGAFADWADGSNNLIGTFEGYDYYATINYQGGDGDDITLYNFSASAIPEPSATALCIAIFAAATTQRRRRH